MQIEIVPLMDGEDVLFGTEMGRTCLADLLARVNEPVAPEVLFLDFKGVASATVSFLREGPLAFRNLLRSQGSNVYPVFANLAPPVSDSLGQYLTTHGDAVYECRLASDGEVEGVALLGRLEAKQDLTFWAVRELGEATAARLADHRGDSDDVGVTAWNNRLAALVGKGLLMEFRRGRSKTFRPALELG